MNPQPNQPNENHLTEGTPAAHAGHVEPKSMAIRRYGKFFWGSVIAVVLILGGVAVYAGYYMAFSKPFTGLTYTVKKEILRVTIVERGNLESAENSDIVCRVKAKTQGGTIASTIKWVIDDGTQVKAGELIVDLDDSGFQEQLKTQKNSVNKARSEWVEAKTNYTIQESQNLSDRKTAEVELIQTKLELKKYAGETAGNKMISLVTYEQIQDYLKKGFDEDVHKESAKLEGKFTSAYLQDVSAFEGTIETARSDKDSWMDRASWSQRMVKKGFYSLSQADADQSRLESMRISLRKAEGDLDIYRIFEREKNVAKKWSDVKEAERKKDRVETQATSKSEKAKADEESKKAIYDQEDEKLQDLKKEEKFYKITAPQDGMIVYYIPEQARFGGGSQQATVAQGEPVREGQKLIRIPNLQKMLVNARVHEAMVSKVKAEDAKGFPGNEAKIRIDAHPGKIYSGHVKTVASVPSQADVFASDVKLYTTMVSIEDLNTKSEKLKPGMSAEVTILADETKVPVLVMPIQAVVGNVAMGAERQCYVIDASGTPQKRKIKIGKSNDKLVEVESGLAEGDQVVLNPRGLLPENSDVKPSTPGGRRGADFDEGASGKKEVKKGDKKGAVVPADKQPGAMPTSDASRPFRSGRYPVMTKKA